MKIIIISGGNININFALDFLKQNKFDLCIAADKGMEALYRLETEYGMILRPDHIVGDFDSVDAAVLSYYMAPGDIKIHQYKPEKDNTDMEIALKLSLDLCKGCENSSEAVILGATGTRLDHVLVNIQMLLKCYYQGLNCMILDANNRIRILPDMMTFSKAESFGRYVSILPLGEKIEGLTLIGFKYPLREHDVYIGDSLCVSNEIIDDTCQIKKNQGLALLIESKD